MGGQHNTFELDNKERRSNNFSYDGGLSLSGLKRFYNAKQNYFEVNGSIYNWYNGYKSKVKDYASDTTFSSVSRKDNNYTGSLNGSFLIGKGRIEQVQDARLALYLLEDLQTLNRNKRSVSNLEVLELAKLITSLKYKRFLDNRLRKIAEITAIDSFMQKTGLVSITDASYFTSLNDNWNFANNPARESGMRIYTGIEGSYSYNCEKTQEKITVPSENVTDRKSKSNDAYIYAVAGIKFENPINLKWQQSAGLKASVGSSYRLYSYEFAGTSDTSRYNGVNPSLKLIADYGYGFYPNSRTWLTANWDLNVIYNKQFIGTSKNDKENSQNSLHMYTGPTVNAYYYISETLRLSISFTGSYQVNYDTYITNIPTGSDDNQTKTRWNHQFEASLTYSLF